MNQIYRPKPLTALFQNISVKSWISMLILFMVAMISLSAQEASAQAKSSVVFVYDGSGSMWGKLEDRTKHEIASEALIDYLDAFGDSLDLGLYAYGHRREKDCRDIEELVPLQSNAKESIKRAIASISPKGRTPLSYTLQLVLDRLSQDNQKATVIMLTDGIESCDGNLCDDVKRALGSGLEFRLHIVGFGIKDTDVASLRCAAEATDGKYFEAANADELSEALTQANDKRLESPDPNVCFTVYRNGEKADALVKFKSSNSREVPALRTYKDRSCHYISPGSYTAIVEILENTDIESRALTGIEVTEGELSEHEVYFDNATLQVDVYNNSEGADALVKVFPQGSDKAVAQARTYGRTVSFNLDPGHYSVHAKAVKIKGAAIEKTIDALELESGAVSSEVFNFESGTLKIGATHDGTLIDCVVKIWPIGESRQVDGGRTYTAPSSNPKAFELTAGRYRVELIPVRHKADSQTFEIELPAGKVVQKNLEF